LNLNGEAFDLSKIDLQSIERIEIIKNNASVYGGTGAIAGIIHFHSREGAGEARMQVGIRANSETGSFGMRKLGWQAGIYAPALSWQVSYQDLTARNGFRYILPEASGVQDEFKRENNARTQTAFSTNIAGQNGSLGYNFNLQYDRFRRQLPGPANFPEIYKFAFLSGNTLWQNLQLRHLRGSWKNQLILWQTTDNTHYDNTRAPNPVNIARYRQAHESRGIRNILTFRHKHWRQDITLESTYRKYNNRNLLLPANSFGRRMDHYAGGTRSALDLEAVGMDVALAAALRYDQSPDDGYLTYRLEGAVIYPWYLDLETGGTWGTSFSLPSFYDLYWKGDTQTVGNPDLKPERSRGYQVWAAVRHYHAHAKVTYHHNQLTDLIQWRQSYLFGPVWKPLNLGKAGIDNWEMELNLQPAKWINLSALMTLTDSRNLVLDSHPRLIYTPERILTLNSEFIWKEWRWWQKLTHTGRQWTTPDNLIAPLEAWTVIDSGINWQRRWGYFNLSAFFRINNLADHSYQIYHYIPQPGRNWSAGMMLEYSGASPEEGQ
ncbi:MAG: hypothetical protein FJ042_04195, partial [Candidatus Cloacimonetes bacterium]|nr:hypothetical protein [Candidatus Cloacimonadota bacterium]